MLKTRASRRAAGIEVTHMSQIYTAFVTLLVLLLYFMLVGNAGRARAKYGVIAPAVTGNENFERAYRVQMNTLEQMVFFLPAMWLYAIFLTDVGAAVGGLLWIAARTLYAVSYMRDPKTRGPGAMGAVVVQIGTFLGALYGVARAMLG
jgi:glutathione S-transferase